MTLIPMVHPFLVFLASSIAFNITAAYTSRHSSLRYVSLAFLALCAYVLPHSLESHAQTTGWVGRVSAGAAFCNIMSCFDRLILRGWDYDHYGPPTDSSDDKEKSSAVRESNDRAARYSGTPMDFGSEVTSNTRGVGLFWQVKNVPQFSDMNPRFVPSRAAFIFTQSVTLLACYYLHNLTVKVMFGLDRSFLSAERVPLLTRLSEVSLAELKARCIASIGYWVVQYCMIQFFYSAGGIVGVMSNPESIKLWRPLFGLPRDASTIRNFWGKSWHQNLRSVLEGISTFFAHGILQLPEKGLIQRYTKVFSSFALSGLMHTAADTGGGLTFLESGAMQFFCMQALGVIIEDSVQAAYGQYFGSAPSRNLYLLKKSIGYTWVVLFVVWTTPVWVFPALLNMRQGDALLSFEAVKPVFFGRSR